MNDKKNKVDQVFSWVITVMLWSAECAIVGAVVYAVTNGKNAWPLVVLALGFGLFLPLKWKWKNGQ
jgi:Na+-transporting NADH:ubiquinone oxidoreductase subunit NqrE